jgi:nucleoside-triphosphatase THEP1
VSTSAISAPSKYLPPWSYDGPLEQAMKRLEYLVTQEVSYLNDPLFPTLPSKKTHPLLQVLRQLFFTIIELDFTKGSGHGYV